MKDRKISRGFIIVAVILSLIVVFATIYVLGSKNNRNSLFEETDKTWVKTDPIQCLGNPWEVDWLKSHGDDYAAYPKGDRSVGLSDEEIQIIKDYYKKQGIVIYDVKWELWDTAVCMACSCPDGYTLYLLISNSDINMMLEFGYTISE